MYGILCILSYLLGLIKTRYYNQITFKFRKEQHENIHALA